MLCIHHMGGVSLAVLVRFNQLCKVRELDARDSECSEDFMVDSKGRSL